MKIRLLKINREVIRMNEQNRLKLDEVLEELYFLREENESLKLDNDFLQRQNNALKMRCSKHCLQIRDLESEIADMKFTRKYLTSEEAGKQFARELLGKTMTPEEVAIEEAENCYVPYTGDDF